MGNIARKNLIIVALSAGLICTLVYLRTLSNGFINLDDQFYIEGNPLIRSLDSATLLKIFTEPHLAAWIPLTYISFAVDYQFWGLKPFGYHLTNTLLHGVNTMLVVLLAGRTLKSCCDVDAVAGEPRNAASYLYCAVPLLAGLLWGLHPLRVESVAWAAERKDVLNGLFTFGAVLFYLRYVEKKDLKGAGTGDYCMSLVLFLLSLLSKQVSVVVPVILVVLDWYPLERIGKRRFSAILVEKLPFLLLSLAVTVITFGLAAKESVLVSADNFPFYARMLVSGNALFEYCRYILYPVGIVPFFPIGETIQSAFVVKTVMVAGFTCYCVVAAGRRPFISSAWYSFVLLLLPVLAFSQTAEDTAFASRYTYLPSAVFSIATAAMVASSYRSLAVVRPALARMAISLLLAALLVSYAAVTLRLIATWKDTGTLWTRQIEILPLGRAYNYRGIYYSSIGNNGAATKDFSTAIEIARQAGRDDIFNLYAYRGETLRALGQHEAAIADLTTAINLSPYPLYYYLRGSSFKALGRLAEAEEDFRLAGNQRGPLPWYREKFEQGR